MKGGTLVALALIGGGVLAIALLTRPNVITVGGNMGDTYITNPPPAQKETEWKPRRLPHINNGDNTNTQTSYTPGGY